MDIKVTIFGKNTWPHTIAAREAYEKESRTVEYINVFDDPSSLEKMLVKSKGERKVPVIVEGDRVTVGYKGKGWTI